MGRTYIYFHRNNALFDIFELGDLDEAGESIALFMDNLNRNKELFYNITCKVKNISDLHKFIDEVKGISSVTAVERIFI